MHVEKARKPKTLNPTLRTYRLLPKPRRTKLRKRKTHNPKAIGFGARMLVCVEA